MLDAVAVESVGAVSSGSWSAGILEPDSEIRPIVLKQGVFLSSDDIIKCQTEAVSAFLKPEVEFQEDKGMTELNRKQNPNWKSIYWIYWNF